MSTPILEKISILPKTLFSKLVREIDTWNFQNKKYENFDPAFYRHYVKGFKVSSISRSNNIDIPDAIKETIDWVKNTVDYCKPVQAMFNVIMPNQQFPIHIDSLNLHQISKRYHICLDNSQVDYYFYHDQEMILKKMDTGFLYFYNNTIPHAVRNTTLSPRINLIIDMIPENVVLDKSLIHPNIDATKQWYDIKKSFSADNQLFEFTKDSIN
jgi:hypothetical protein